MQAFTLWKANLSFQAELHTTFQWMMQEYKSCKKSAEGKFIMLTAQQEIRQRLTGDPYGEPVFPHEGPHIIRWLTGGTEADAYVTFHSEGNETIARCPKCKAELGRFDASYGRRTGQQIGAI